MGKNKALIRFVVSTKSYFLYLLLFVWIQKEIRDPGPLEDSLVRQYVYRRMLKIISTKDEIMSQTMTFDESSIQ